MNYYVKGDAAKAQQIKAAFERLGIDVLDFGFADKTVVYCSIGGACVQSLPYSINLMHILYSHPGYKELPVQPDFKVGDWVVRKDGETFYGGNYAEQITLIEVDEKGKCIWLSSTSWVNDDDIRLWSIQDAKDGDVLVSGIDNPFIYDGNIEFSSAGAYVGVSRNGRIRLDMFPSKAWTSIKDVKPATKEQRDRLFAKLREAGYEWDADKKELRKIQHYDIANFHAGMPVLVRNGDCLEWEYVTFSHYRKVGTPFCAGGQYWYQCIPFDDDTKHLLGTTDKPSEEYINW